VIYVEASQSNVLLRYLSSKMVYDQRSEVIVVSLFTDDLIDTHASTVLPAPA
jgi:hypothetical protein